MATDSGVAHRGCVAWHAILRSDVVLTAVTICSHNRAFWVDTKVSQSTDGPINQKHASSSTTSKLTTAQTRHSSGQPTEINLDSSTRRPRVSKDSVRRRRVAVRTAARSATAVVGREARVVLEFTCTSAQRRRKLVRAVTLLVLLGSTTGAGKKGPRRVLEQAQGWRIVFKQADAVRSTGVLPAARRHDATARGLLPSTRLRTAHVRAAAHVPAAR